jgi:integrase
MVRCDPAGEELPRQARIFGDALGQPVGSIRKSWQTAVLLAHGHTPRWTTTKALAPDSRAALRAIDLHFHDLRHEAGSRMLEAGWPLHHVQKMLGHAAVKQTATYPKRGARRPPRVDGTVRGPRLRGNPWQKTDDRGATAF